MKIIDKVTPIKTFGELERGEVFKGCSSGNVYIKVSHCYSDTDIEDFLNYDGSLYSIDELADDYNGFNAVSLNGGILAFFDDFCKVTPLTTELHIL